MARTSCPPSMWLRPFHKKINLACAVLALIIAGIFAVHQSFTSSSQSKELGTDSNSVRTRTKERGSQQHEAARPRAVRLEVIDQFSEEKQVEFYLDGGDITEHYINVGLMNFYGTLRGALKGNSDNLSSIFSEYSSGAGTEGFAPYIEILIENLSDRYFTEQLRKQPERIQRLIADQIWVTATRSPDPGRSATEIPLTDSGRYYHFAGQLLLELEAHRK